METFFLTPEMFDNYIAFDPSLWWNNHYLVRTAKENLAKFPISDKRIWFASSDAEDVSPFTKELAGIFKQRTKKILNGNFQTNQKKNIRQFSEQRRKKQLFGH